MDELEKAINEYTESIGSNPVDRSEEEAWNEFLDESLPAPAIIGTENKVVNNRLIEGKKVLCIIDRDFNIIEETDNLWDRGDFSDEANELLEKHGFEAGDIEFLDESIEQTKLSLHTEFSIDNIEDEFLKESSDEYEEFKNEMSVLGQESIDKFLNND
ncbi:MAG: hypothetical protein SLAVMIC_00031 [uncultured marine phage]|uniref:Uncharacterized protein n=1 Tax=uncultured marine phage TaxID=707152 RepID=A0A8D9C879_9VIRU|nr:MAG: hypothetical protein SLAVMIC_00031 [uncultured marine phage]